MGAVPRVSLSHGRGLTAVYRAWLRQAEPYAQGSFDRAAALLGGGSIHDAVGALLSELEMTQTLDDSGFEGADVDAFMAGLTGNVENDPIDGLDANLIRAVYAESFSPDPVAR
jgi:hypothetical protein